MNTLQSSNTITVIGLGKTGISLLKYLKKTFPLDKINVIDTRDNPANINDVPQGINITTGGLNQNILNNSNLIIASPGIDLRQPEFIIANQHGANIIGDVEFFAQELKRLQLFPKIVAITGSNGKSTVTTLCYNALKDQNKNVAMGGNIGIPVFDIINDDYDYYVLELSSFQLETVKSLHTVSSVHLNLSQDHLDRYDSMDQYNLAKHNVFNNTQNAIYNIDDLNTKPLNLIESSNLVSFSGLSNANYTLDHCENTKLIHNKEAILSENDIKLVGQHNLTNILATFALLEPLGLDFEKTKQTIKDFPGLEHRCQVVKNVNNIKWVNDSKATNLGSVIACLSGLKVKNKLHLLMGGDAKGADLSPLKKYLKMFNCQLYCFGKDQSLISNLDTTAKSFTTMEEAIEDLRPILESGDMVLLSPACGSIDQFKNFEERGLIFEQLANK